MRQTRKKNKDKKKQNKTKNKHKEESIQQKSRKRGFSKLQCSPGANKTNFSCYDNETLNKIKSMWNVKHPDVLINTNDAKEIWMRLKENLKSVCHNEACWLRQKFIDNNMASELLSYSFAPEAPIEWKSNPREWLSSIDIEKVMRQYENKYSQFSFIGPSPIDFDKKKLFGQCVWTELCNFNLKEHLDKGKTKIGVVFNTDPHYKAGSHWIALFIDIKKQFIYFFDSNGNYVPKRIEKFVKRVQKQAKFLNIDLSFEENYPRIHQDRDSECGIYVIYFIVKLIQGKNRKFFKDQKILDTDMLKLRKKYFNECLK
jgi:hypothetical protein